MSSHDGSDRPNRPRRSQQPRRAQAPRRSQADDAWEIDSADIDRYLSGRPAREQETRRTAPSSRGQQDDTASQLDQLQHAMETRQARRQPRQTSAGRQQFAEPEPEIVDDWIDDEYSVDPRGYDTGYDDVYDEGFEDDYVAPQEPPRRRRQPQSRQRPAGASQPPRRREPPPVVYDDEYDEELYADDPYLTYADEDDWEEPAPRRPSRRRQQPRLNKPNLPKITIPASISQSELANDIPSLAMLGSAILSASIMAIVVSNRLDMLPGVIPTHVSASGVPENLAGRNALWSIPLLSVAISLMNFGAAWFVSRIDMFAARFLVAGALLVQFIAWIAVIEYLW